MQPSHSPHLGYVSLFPFFLGILPWEHPRARRLLEALQPPPDGKKQHQAGIDTLWSPYGILSLSSKDPLFRQGEDYWRGKIWINMNFLALCSLAWHARKAGVSADLARAAFDSLRSGLVSNVLRVFESQRYFFENFDPVSGEGRGTAPFSGWTTLVALVMAEEPLAVDLASLLGDNKANFEL